MKNARKFYFKIAFALILLVGAMGCDPSEPEVITEKDLGGTIIPIKQAQELYDTYSERRVELIRDFENNLDSLDLENEDSDDEEPTGQVQGNEGKIQTIQKRMTQRNGEGFQPTRFAFSDYESLKKYMAFIEQEAKKANVKISTLRFYFANYPDKDEFSEDRPITEQRRNTLVFVPTLNTGEEEFAFFTAEDSEDGQRKAYLVDDKLIENQKSFGGDNQEKASMTFSIDAPSNAPFNYTNAQSLYGNEWGLKPPK